MKYDMQAMFFRIEALCALTFIFANSYAGFMAAMCQHSDLRKSINTPTFSAKSYSFEIFEHSQVP
jgi:hypothetical protein